MDKQKIDSNNAPFWNVQENPLYLFKKLGFLTLLMIVLPLLTYFFSKFIIFEGLLAMTTSNSYFYAAIVAIIAVHVFLAIFVYVAVMEETRPYPPKRD